MCVSSIHILKISSESRKAYQELLATVKVVWGRSWPRKVHIYHINLVKDDLNTFKAIRAMITKVKVALKAKEQKVKKEY